MLRPMLLGIVLATTAVGSQAAIRDKLSIVGSSTVYPFAKRVAEHLVADQSEMARPLLQSTGSGSGFKAFCQGVGSDYPDITNASRRIKQSELEACAKAGVKGVVEVRIGYDGIVLTNSRKGVKFSLERKDVFLALAAEVPAPSGDGAIANPYKKWSEINPSLPDVPIKVIGPPQGSGTREAFIELAMETGCKRQGASWTADMVKQRGAQGFREMCDNLRTDGAWVDGGEDDEKIVEALVEQPDAMGVFGFSYLLENQDKIQGATIEDAEPTFNNISYRFYDLARPLFFYIKKEHIDLVPGMREYIQSFASEAAWGKDGYLAAHGLVPMNDKERAQFAGVVRDLTVLDSL